MERPGIGANPARSRSLSTVPIGVSARRVGRDLHVSRQMRMFQKVADSGNGNVLRSRVNARVRAHLSPGRGRDQILRVEFRRERSAGGDAHAAVKAAVGRSGCRATWDREDGSIHMAASGSVFCGVAVARAGVGDGASAGARRQHPPDLSIASPSLGWWLQQQLLGTHCFPLPHCPANERPESAERPSAATHASAIQREPRPRKCIALNMPPSTRRRKLGKPKKRWPGARGWRAFSRPLVSCYRISLPHSVHRFVHARSKLERELTFDKARSN